MSIGAVKFLLLACALPQSEAAISSAEKKEMLELHNMYRCMAGVPALKWDDTLQKQAQSWADTGQTAHSTSRGAFSKYGENIHMSCPSDTPKTATEWWYAEIKKYSPTSYSQSAHYTQMVWAGTTKIGCGKGRTHAFGCAGDSWFCQYTKMGNWNMPGSLAANVIAPTKSKAEAKAGKCAGSGGGGGAPSPPPADKSGGGGGAPSPPPADKSGGGGGGESACMCPSSHPSCYSDGKCWMRSSGGWNTKPLSCGTCTSSYASSSQTLTNGASENGKCYAYFGSSNAWCYTKNKQGAFATSGCSSYNGYGEEWCCPDKYRCHGASPAPAPSTSSFKLRDSGMGERGKCYSYYGSKEKPQWCYTTNGDSKGSFASSNCASYNGYKTTWCCPEKYKCKASGSSSSSSSGSGACKASKLGEYISNFVKGKTGRKVYSDQQGTASCWDLAKAAMEQAAKHGYNPVQPPDSYVWSTKTVDVTDAQPGDIAQFKGWQENVDGYSMSAWNPHTAVVTECYKDGVLTVHQQNPSAVAEGKYHPGKEQSGSVTIYRLQSSRLRLYSQKPQLSVFGFHSEQFNVLAGVASVAGLLALASFIVKRQRSVAQRSPPSPEEGPFLEVESIESVEVPIE